MPEIRGYRAGPDFLANLDRGISLFKDLGIKKVLVDMDGVLADFVTGSLRLFNRPESLEDVTHWNYYEDWGLSDREFWADINAQGISFWEDLPLTSDHSQVLDLAYTLDPDYRIITAPSRHWTSLVGKIKWLRRHAVHFPGELLTDLPGNLLFSREKWRYADKETLLIDDGWHNTLPFSELGHALLWSRPWNENWEEEYRGS